MKINSSFLPRFIFRVCQEWYDGFDSEMYKVAFPTKDFQVNIEKLKQELTECYESATTESWKQTLKKALDWFAEQKALESSKNAIRRKLIILKENNMSRRDARHFLTSMLDEVWDD